MVFKQGVVSKVETWVEAKPNPGKRSWKTLWLKRHGKVSFERLVLRFLLEGQPMISIDWGKEIVLLAHESSDQEE